MIGTYVTKEQVGCMKRIEEVAPKVTSDLADRIYDFWSRNVNCEHIMGKSLSDNVRGTEAYFKDLEKQRYRSHRHLLPWIKEMEPGRSVLEVGCGIGLDAFQMAKHGLKVTAVDLTDVAIDTVRNRFKQNALSGEFKVSDATNLPFEENVFDYVYSFGVLHHAQDTAASIEEVYRVLKPGGEAKIMLYNRHSLNEVVHRITKIPFEDKNELCPVVRRYTVKEIKQIFSSFCDVRIKKEFVYGEGYGKHKLLSTWWGWHLMINAKKSV